MGVSVGQNTIYVNSLGLDGVMAEFNALPDQVKRASKRAVNGTLKWIFTRAKRDISARTGLAQKLLANRLKVTDARDMASGIVAGKAWIGLNPVRVTSDLFNVRQTATGARAGRFAFDGAFVFANPKRDKPGIYKRRGKKRTPIDLVKIEVDSDGTRETIDTVAADAGDILIERLRRELNYEVNVR